MRLRAFPHPAAAHRTEEHSAEQAGAALMSLNSVIVAVNARFLNVER